MMASAGVIMSLFLLYRGYKISSLLTLHFPMFYAAGTAYIRYSLKSMTIFAFQDVINKTFGSMIYYLSR